MRIHNLKSPLKKRGIKRIGRGGKRGTYSGRGQKGQGARAGHKIRPAERELILKLPKFRGIKNKPVFKKPLIINLGDFDRFFASGEINKEILLKTGLIKRISDQVKILGNGEIKKPITLKGFKVSESAKKKIEAAGGKIE
ncbi:MAG: 50S ribosomal protein L15 [Patescibacteria group bacterium]